MQSRDNSGAYTDFLRGVVSGLPCTPCTQCGTESVRASQLECR